MRQRHAQQPRARLAVLRMRAVDDNACDNIARAVEKTADQHDQGNLGDIDAHNVGVEISKDYVDQGNDRRLRRTAAHITGACAQGEFILGWIHIP